MFCGVFVYVCFYVTVNSYLFVVVVWLICTVVQ